VPSHRKERAGSSGMVGGLLAQSVGWDLFRDDLLEAFTAYCGSERALPLSGFLSFADSFDISAYLSPERVAEIFETATGQGKKSSVSFEEFKECICLCALAVSAKQWQARRASAPLLAASRRVTRSHRARRLRQVEYAAEKRARYQYKRTDAEKSHSAPSLAAAVEQLLEALDFGNPIRFSKRLPARPVSATRRDSPYKAAEAAAAAAAHEGGARGSSALGSLEARLQALPLQLAASGAADPRRAKAASNAPPPGGAGNSPRPGATTASGAPPPRRPGGSRGGARGGEPTGVRIYASAPLEIGSSGQPQQGGSPRSPRRAQHARGAGGGGTTAILPTPPPGPAPGTPGTPRTQVAPARPAGARSPRRVRVVESAGGGPPPPPFSPLVPGNLARGLEVACGVRASSADGHRPAPQRIDAPPRKGGEGATGGVGGASAKQRVPLENAHPNAPSPGAAAHAAATAAAQQYSRQYFSLGVGGRTLPLSHQGFADAVSVSRQVGATPPARQRKRSASFNRPKQPSQGPKPRQRSASFQRQPRPHSSGPQGAWS